MRLITLAVAGCLLPAVSRGEAQSFRPPPALAAVDLAPSAVDSAAWYVRARLAGQLPGVLVYGPADSDMMNEAPRGERAYHAGDAWAIGRLLRVRAVLGVRGARAGRSVELRAYRVAVRGVAQTAARAGPPIAVARGATREAAAEQLAATLLRRRLLPIDSARAP